MPFVVSANVFFLFALYFFSLISGVCISLLLPMLALSFSTVTAGAAKQERLLKIHKRLNSFTIHSILGERETFFVYLFCVCIRVHYEWSGLTSVSVCVCVRMCCCVPRNWRVAIRFFTRLYTVFIVQWALLCCVFFSRVVWHCKIYRKIYYIICKHLFYICTCICS